MNVMCNSWENKLLLLYYYYSLIFTWGQFWHLGIIIACICLFVHVCVHVNPNSLLHVQVRITKFWSEVQYTLVDIPIILGLIDLNLQGQI